MIGAPMLLDNQLRPVAILDRSVSLSWELKHNDLHTAEITLSRDDPRNEQCTAFAWVHLWDGMRDLGLYRINGMPGGEEHPGGVMTYSLEHLLSLLLDDVIFGELTLEAVPFGDALRQVLSYQSTPRWVLGDCDFDLQVTDTLGNETLLSAVQRLCGKLTEDYTWDYDTHALPFVLHIRRADQDNGCGVHFGRNMVSVSRQMDATKVVTCLYLLGGADDKGGQVTVESLTGDGAAYIDADTISTWGIRTAIYQNGDLTTPEALMERGREVLDAINHPHYAYQVSALDLYRLTGYAWDLFAPGKKVLVMDDQRGVRFSARIVSVAKQDAGADPGSVTLTIASQPRDELDAVAAITQKLQSVETNGIRTAAQLPLRATLEQYNALTGRITQAESTLDVQAESISLISGRVTTLEGDMTDTKAQIEVNNDSIGALVTKTETLGGRLTTAETAIEVNAKGITAEVTRATGAEGTLGESISAVRQSADAVSLEVRNARGDEATLSGKFTVMQESIEGEVARAENAEKGLTESISAVRQSADAVSLEVRNARGDEKTLSANLTVMKNSIASLVEKTGVNELGETEKLSTKIEQTAESITQCVKKDDDISSMIALSGDGVTISGGVITLTGYVTAEELEASYIKADELAGKIADLSDLSVTSLSVSGTAHTTNLQVWGQASIGGNTCSPHTLTIGEKTCTFFAPADATFNLSDMPGYADALDAARMEGASAGYDNGYYDGLMDGYADGYAAAKAATKVEGGLKPITNVAPNTMYASGWARATVDGEQVDYTTFSTSTTFPGLGQG